MAQLLPTIRYDMLFESDRIRDSEFEENYNRLVEANSLQDNAQPISRFLSVDDETARQIADPPPVC